MEGGGVEGGGVEGGRVRESRRGKGKMDGKLCT